MLSALIIFLSFGAILVFLNRTELIIDSTSRVIFSFVGSLSALSVLYFCLLLLPGQLGWVSKLTLLIGPAVLGGIFYFNRYYARSCMLDIEYVSGWSLNARDEETRTLGAFAERKGRSLYRLVFAAACFVIVFANIANPSPANWDSNTYNVARISSMIAGASPFVEQTSVARQAVLSLSHDVLFYPDILMHNTRGLGLVCGLEFIALMCIISQVSLSFISRLRNSSIHISDISIYPVLILSLCLLLSSDMQSMQAVITKNDLIITLCFTSGIYLASKYTSNEISTATLLMVSMLIGICSLTSKSYGVIVFLPLVTSFGYAVFSTVSRMWPQGITEPSLLLKSLIIRVKNLARQVISSPARMVYSTAFVGLSATQLYIDYRIRQFASINYSAEITSITKSWTNSGNGFGEALFIFLINTTRSAVSILVYSLSSIPCLGPRLSSRLIKLLNFGVLTLDIGTGGGTVFGWPGYGPDTSHTSFFVVTSIILSFVAWRRLGRQYSLYLLPDMTRLNRNLSALFLVILSSCVLAYFAITYAILYQPWIGRFLGPSYVPLIPVSSFILAQYFHLNNKNLRLPGYLFNAKFLIPVVSMLMCVSHVNASSFRSDFHLAFSSGYTGIPLPERRYANHIAEITKVEPSSYGPLLQHLRVSEFKQRFICTGEDSWMLTPMMSSMENKSYTGSNLVSIPTKACDKEVGLAKRPDSLASTDKGSLIPKIYIKKDAEYIYLP